VLRFPHLQIQFAFSLLIGVMLYLAQRFWIFSRSTEAD
jgi:hypothetical protein